MTSCFVLFFLHNTCADISWCFNMGASRSFVFLLLQLHVSSPLFSFLSIPVTTGLPPRLLSKTKFCWWKLSSGFLGFFFSFCSSFYTEQQLFLLASYEWRIIYDLFSFLCSMLDSSCSHLILIVSCEHSLLSNKYLLPLLKSFLFPSGALKNTATNPAVLRALLYNSSLVQNTNAIQFVCFWGYK